MLKRIPVKSLKDKTRFSKRQQYEYHQFSKDKPSLMIHIKSSVSLF